MLKEGVVGEIAPDEMLHIGNRLNVDYAGALGAGCKAIILDRSGSVVKDKLMKGRNYRWAPLRYLSVAYQEITVCLSILTEYR